MADLNGMGVPHNLTLKGRNELSITGVTDIDSFDEESIVLFTDLGELCIKGTGLHINKIDVEAGNVAVEGEVYSLEYSENKIHRGGFFSKLFR